VRSGLKKEIVSDGNANYKADALSEPVSTPIHVNDIGEFI